MTVWTEGAWTKAGEAILPDPLPEFVFLFKLTRHSDGSDHFWRYLTLCDNRTLQTLLTTFSVYAQAGNKELPRWFWSEIPAPSHLPEEPPDV